MRQLGRVAANLPEYLAGLVLLAIVVFVSLGVFFRYFLQTSLSWADEGSRYLLIWLTLLGAASAVKHSSHFRVDQVVAHLGGRLHAAAEVAGRFSMTLFGAILFTQGLELTRASRETTSPALQISLALIYVALPIGGALILLYSLPPLVGACRRLANPTPPVAVPASPPRAGAQEMSKDRKVAP